MVIKIRVQCKYIFIFIIFLTVFTRREWMMLHVPWLLLFSGFGLKGKKSFFSTDRKEKQQHKKQKPDSQSVWFPWPVECPKWREEWESAGVCYSRFDKVPHKHRHHENWNTAAPFSLRDPTSSLRCPPSSFLTEHQCLLASSLGMWGRVQPHEARSGGKINVCVNEIEVSAFLNGCSIGVGRELWQAGLLGSSIVGEDRVLAGGAGWAAGVWVARGVLVKRHWQLQILLYTQKEDKTLAFHFQIKCFCFFLVWWGQEDSPGWMTWPGSDPNPPPAVWMWVSERAQHASSPSSSYTCRDWEWHWVGFL